MLYLRFFFFALLLPVITTAQELPPITSFPTEAEYAGNQNWMLSQDEDGRMYVANSKGLLEFTGTEWTLYPSPNETTIRAVRAVGDRIYTGCYREFGYWLRAADGQLTYHSLATAVRERMRADEHFWNIIAFEGRIVFQSLDQLFLYNPATEAIDPISPEAGVDKLFRTDAGLYFTDRERHLFQLREGSILPVSIRVGHRCTSDPPPGKGR